MYPPDYRYTEEHEWVKVEGDTVVVGITEFAQSELGDVVFVEVPEVGSSYEINDEVGTIESVKAVAEVYAPLTGEVVEVNDRLEERPELVNDEPHGDGWLYRMKPSAPEQVDELLTVEAYESFIEHSG